MGTEHYTDLNARVISSWADEGWEWGRPIDHETFARATQGDWQLVLTPTVPVPDSWYPPLADAEVLGLASGGGQQMPILTAAGAHCTVLDYAPAQLEAERQVAEREGYDITLVQADMTRPLPFASESFDLVINPVSLCYVREVDPIWREVVRVLRPGGVLLTGLDTAINYVTDPAEERIVRGLPYDPIANPKLMEEDDPEEWGMQFSHNTGELLRGILRAGLIVDDAYDDINGEGHLAELNIPSYLALRAHKPTGARL